jgi:5-methylthioadenosine/S-adenosylhomocysteine deaminase
LTDASGRVLIRDATILTVDPDDRLLDPGDLVFEDGRITYVGPADAAGAHRQGPFDREIDGSRLVVTPGFVNAHTHTYATLFKGSYELMPLDLWLVAMRAPTRALSEEQLYLSSLIADVEMLRTGTTTSLDHYFGNPALPSAGISSAVRAAADAGLRSAIAFVLMDMRWEETLPLDASAVAAASGAAGDVTSRETAQGIEAARAFIEANAGVSDRVTTVIGPSAAHRCSDALLRACRDLADETKSPIHMHVGEAKSHALQNRAIFGSSLIGRLDELDVLGPDVSMAHCGCLDDDALDRIARRGATVVHNPASNLKLGSGVARVREMLQRGVHVAVATDGPCSSDNFNMFEALRLAGLLHTSNQVDYLDWLPARRVLRMATIEGARAAGLDHVVGSLEVGKAADLVLLRRDSLHWAARNDSFVQLVYSENGSSIDSVYVDGQLRVQDGHVVGIDEERLYRAVGAARDALEPSRAESAATVAPIAGPVHERWERLRDEPLDGVTPTSVFR